MIINSTQQTNSIVFIDGSLHDLQTLPSGLDPSVTAIALDPELDGIRQMTNALAGMSQLKHIVLVDSANHNAVTVYHSADLAGNGTETALVILSGVNIANLMAGNFLVQPSNLLVHAVVLAEQ